MKAIDDRYLELRSSSRYVENLLRDIEDSIRANFKEDKKISIDEQQVYANLLSEREREEEYCMEDYVEHAKVNYPELYEARISFKISLSLIRQEIRKLDRGISELLKNY